MGAAVAPEPVQRPGGRLARVRVRLHHRRRFLQGGNHRRRPIQRRSRPDERRRVSTGGHWNARHDIGAAGAAGVAAGACCWLRYRRCLPWIWFWISAFSMIDNDLSSFVWDTDRLPACVCHPTSGAGPTPATATHLSAWDRRRCCPRCANRKCPTANSGTTPVLASPDQRCGPAAERMATDAELGGRFRLHLLRLHRRVERLRRPLRRRHPGGHPLCITRVLRLCFDGRLSGVPEWGLLCVCAAGLPRPGRPGRPASTRCRATAGSATSSCPIPSDALQ